MLHQLIYRPYATAHPRLPFGVRSTGHYVVPSGWSECFEPRHFAELWYTTGGGGSFRLGREETHVRPGAVMIIPAGFEQRLTASTDQWEFHWVTLDGRGCNQALEWFGIKAGAYSDAYLPLGLFEELTDSIIDGTFAGQKRAAALVFSLLASIPADLSAPSPEPRVDACVKIINQNYSDSEFDVNTLAELAGMHRSQISRLFSQVLGVSPSAYLKELRLRTGISLLRDSNLRVAEIAWRCGFREPGYFSRLIRQSTGKSPREVRDPGSVSLDHSPRQS